MNKIKCAIKETPESFLTTSARWGHYRKLAVCTCRGSSPEPNHAGSLILDSQLPELWEIEFCCLNANNNNHMNSLNILNKPVSCSLQLYLKIYKESYK